jgi:hypothetical protein
LRKIRNKNNEKRNIPDSNNPHHIQISLEILVKNINSSHNWKSPGGDQIHNFWLKKFTCIHKCLLDHFNGFIREPNTFPEFDIGMSFGIDKCKTQSICRGHYENLEYAVHFF